MTLHIFPATSVTELLHIIYEVAQIAQILITDHFFPSTFSKGTFRQSFKLHGRKQKGFRGTFCQRKGFSIILQRVRTI